ncbi:hypothetical protein C8J57DRAFT_1599577 [Mycena rebaudengoi]|nr:hypothetical protein C8J57DRAFT_1599577 [Mycena rebaudengoi]
MTTACHPARIAVYSRRHTCYVDGPSAKRRTQALRIHRPPLPPEEPEPEPGNPVPDPEYAEERERERAPPSKYPTPLPDEGQITLVEEAEAAPPTPEEAGHELVIGDGTVSSVEARVDKPDEAVVQKQEDAVATKGLEGNGRRRSREESAAHLRAPEAPSRPSHHFIPFYKICLRYAPATANIQTNEGT